MSFGPAARINMVPVTYWAPSSVGSDSEVSYDTPIIIKGRWVDKSEVYYNARGEEVTSKAIVIVDQDVEESGYLAFGDQTSILLPTIADAYEIQGFTSRPDLRNLEQVRRAYL